MKEMLIGELIIKASNDHCQMSLSFLLFGRDINRLLISHVCISTARLQWLTKCLSPSTMAWQ